MIAQEQIQKTKVIADDFTPAEAEDLVSSLIRIYINFYKLQHLSQWERNHAISDSYLNEKIAELQAKEIELNNTILLAKETGCTIKLDGIIRLKLIK